MNFTEAQIRKAMECKTADELLALAKAEGVELTRDQAEEYIKLMGARELTDEELAKVAGGNYQQDIFETAMNSSSGCSKNCVCHRL